MKVSLLNACYHAGHLAAVEKNTSAGLQHSLQSALKLTQKEGYATKRKGTANSSSHGAILWTQERGRRFLCVG